MRPPLRQNIKFYLNVEGETEKWYFEHLRDLVNASPGVRYKLALRCDVEKEPLAMAKRLAVPKGARIDVWHVSDFESESDQHRRSFQDTLRQMRDACNMGKRLTYRSAYSNFTFDLWMVLHRRGVVHCGHRDEYLRQINAAYGTQFREMHEYKREENFKGLLADIGLEDVADAVERAKRMNESTTRNGARTAEPSKPTPPYDSYAGVPFWYTDPSPVPRRYAETSSFFGRPACRRPFPERTASKGRNHRHERIQARKHTSLPPPLSVNRTH